MYAIINYINNIIIYITEILNYINISLNINIYFFIIFLFY